MGKLVKKMSHYLWLYAPCYKAYAFVNGLFPDELKIKVKYSHYFKRKLDLENPRRFTEKIQWLKLNDRKDFYTTCADKFEARKYIKERFGESYLVPLLFQTYNWKDITYDNMPECPFALKSNNGSGTVRIIRDKRNENWNKLRRLCRFWLGINHYELSEEWQYKNMRPCIIAEKLLLTREGKLPNDYKLHYFNGHLEFVYCSIDREGTNNRNIYDAEWNPLPFMLIRKSKYRDDLRGPEIPVPPSFAEMKRIGSEVAQNFPYVRVDFYDVDGKLYMGEITLYHGSGFDSFIPDKYDLVYGEKLDIKGQTKCKKESVL